MRVKMLITQKGCDDDNLNLVKIYHKDEEYNVGPSLGGVFIRERWAEEVEEPTPEEKDEGSSEENKDEGAPKENKAPPSEPEKKGSSKKK